VNIFALEMQAQEHIGEVANGAESAWFLKDNDIELAIGGVGVGDKAQTSAIAVDVKDKRV
jgi:hypothetical protein